MFWKRLGYLLPWRRRAAERDMREELRAIAAMAEPGELGNLTLAAEDARAELGWTRLEQTAQDLRYAFRMLGKNKSFTFIAVLTLALGIGATTAIFSVVNATLLQPLPFKDPDRIVSIREGALSLPNYFDLRNQNQVFDQVAAWSVEIANFTSGREPEMIQYGLVSSNVFGVLGVQPRVGRAFLPAEDLRGCAPVVILGHNLWQRQFDADPNLLGKTVVIDGRPHEVIGIMPADFRFLNYASAGGRETEAWMPFGLNTWADGWNCRTCQWLNGAARLKDGVTLEQAQAGTDAIGKQLGTIHRELNWNLSLSTLNDVVVKDFKRALLILLGAVGVVLLIACTNVASLVLVRAQSREREIAFRAALGATRSRLVRQFLTENLVLSIGGGALGLLFAKWGIALLALGSYYTAASPYNTAPDQIGIDTGVLLFTLVATLVSGLSFGLIPALAATRGDVTEFLKTRAQTTAGWRQRRAHRWLIVAEVALSVTLLVGAGLLMRSFWRLYSTNPGFRTQNVLTFLVALPQGKYADEPRIANFQRQMLEMIETLPEVTSAGTVEYLPLSGGNGSNLTWIEGPPLQRVSVRFRHVSPRYFETLGIPLIEGRPFSSRDGKRAQPVAIVNEAMARRFWPDGKPLGKRLSFVGEALEFHEDGPPTLVPSRLREVVGVVGDIRHTRLGDPPAPELFIPADQQPQLVTAVVVRTRTDPMKLVKAVRHVVLSLDREQPISYVKTLDQYLSASVAKPRFNFLLMTVLAALSLILAIVGIYGLMSHTVAQRTREVGVRIALGADGYTVVAMLVRQGMWPALAGILIGLVAAAGLTQLLKSLLFDVTATDPMTFALVACLLTGAALVACYIPARRAATIGPIAALKCE